ncbi:glycoside hydrolase [Acephala macrosclerotiorum]|nr:glycoside hydrolase [Acephala macrosclerotiorum]
MEISSVKSKASQCGGIRWTGPTTCTAGCTQISNLQKSTIKTSSTFSTSTISCSTLRLSSSSATPPSCATSNPRPPTAGKAQFAGIGAYCPPGPTYGLPDGPGQMAHFASQDKFNIFRLNVGWQFITTSQYTAIPMLDPTNLAIYDFLVQSCLASGAYCLIDFHDFARFRGPTDAIRAATWGNIAAKYKNQSKVVFGLMNEPHNAPSVVTRAASCQAAVTAIVLSGPALSAVTNPDGSFNNLVFNVRKYLDSGSSGTHIESWIWLRCSGRQALLSEIGGGFVASCELYVCQAIAYLNANSDVYLGYIASYILTETPTLTNSVYVDTQLVTQCLVPY